jgi:hypothetical protein
MYYTGIHPMTGKRVNVTTDYHEKQLQRALLQYSRPENANLVREALKLAGREDLIGNSPECLVRPAFGQGARAAAAKRGAPASGRQGSYKDARGSVVSKKSSSGSAKKSGSGASKRSGSRTLAKSAQMLSQDTRRTKKSKLDRVFGEDAARILREADKMVGSGNKKRKNSR